MKVYHLILVFVLLPFVAAAQITPKTDSLIPFEKTIKTWYVQELVEVGRENHKTYSMDTNILVIANFVQDPKTWNVECHYLVAEKQKYSWKITEFALACNHSIDSAYFRQINNKGRPELVMNWSYANGASGTDFSWSERMGGIIVMDLETQKIILRDTTYLYDNHFGTSVDETLMYKLKKTGFDEVGRFIEKDAMSETILDQKQDIVFDKGTVTFSLRSMDPKKEDKAVLTWPVVKYRLTETNWKKIK